MKFKKFFAADIALSLTGNGLTAVRSGYRVVLADKVGDYSLSKHISGQLPYYYRKIDSIVEDFKSEHNALELLVDLMATAPKTTTFRNSHCGEIVAAHFVEEKLGLRRLYSKLTMTTSEDTNAHKMDALFVDLSKTPYEYIFVEAKASILPTTPGEKIYHRNGLLKRMIESLDRYEAEEPRFEFVRIRENLESGFEAKQRAQILQHLRPPGPEVHFLGVSVTNSSTVSADDDDFILAAPGKQAFDYYGVVVTDLAALAKDSYSIWDKVKIATESNGDV